MTTDQNTKLILTAAGAAVAGGVAAVAFIKLLDRKREDSFRPTHHQQIKERFRKSGSFQIFEDPEHPNNQRILFPYNHEEKMRQTIAARHAVEEDNSLPRNSVTVRVPATSANMGPGCEFHDRIC
jgi:hypothetical protein